MGPLCPGLGPEQLASGRKPGKVPPQPLEVSSLAGLGWAGQVPLLSPQGQLAQAGAMLERQVGCDWTGWELASWPGEPQPSSESIPSLGKGEVGSSQQGAASPPHPTPTKSSTLSPPPTSSSFICLKVGSGCQPVPGQTPLPLFNLTYFA